MNAERMLRLADVLEAQHAYEMEGATEKPVANFDRYDQMVGIRVRDCDTAGCLAGLTIALFAPDWWAERRLCEQHDALYPYPSADACGGSPGIMELAGHLLGIPDTSPLFDGVPDGMPCPSARDAALWVRGCVAAGMIVTPRLAMEILERQSAASNEGSTS